MRTFARTFSAASRHRHEHRRERGRDGDGRRFGLGYPVTVNDPQLTERMVPTLRRVAGAENVRVGPLTGTAEDFSFFQQKVPGLFFFLGVTPKDQDPPKARDEPLAAVLRRRVGVAGRREGDDEPRARLLVRRQIDQSAEADVADAADVIDR